MNFEMGRVFDVALAIVGVAMATAILRSPNTANVITSIGGAFSQGVRAGLGG